METNNYAGTIEQMDQARAVFRAYPVLFFIGALFVLGQILKASALPRKWIPAVLSVSGAILTPLVVDAFPVVKLFPFTMQILAGFVTGFVASGLYGAASLLPWLKDKEWFKELAGEPEKKSSELAPKPHGERTEHEGQS